MGDLHWHSVVTFESDGGVEPTCVRATIVDSEPDSAARKAVFRAVRDAKPRKYESVVIVLTKVQTDVLAAQREPKA